MLANLLALHMNAISKATNGQFSFSHQALHVIADKVQENGYEDDISVNDVRKGIEDRVYQ